LDDLCLTGRPFCDFHIALHHHFRYRDRANIGRAARVGVNSTTWALESPRLKGD
jgi:hypothetical protein